MQKKLFFLIYTFLLFNFHLSGQQYSKPKIIDVLGRDKAEISCGYPLNGNCLDLKVVDVPALYETTSYNVSTVTYSPPSAFNAGTKLNADADDSFINKITIPFDFCYFGTSYSDVVVGSNGVITFDNAQVGNPNYPNVVNSNPSITLPQNSIFGVYSDLIFSKNDDSEIYYNVVGTAPTRKFIVSFYKGTIVGCDGSAVTSQIVLSEGSNIVEIFVESKPAPCPEAKFKNSLLGIINGDGTLGYSPANRNTGVWSAQREAYRFTPAGTAVTPQYSWFNAAKEIIGRGQTISVCPDKNEVYTVKIEYPICGTAPSILEDDFPVNFAADYPVLKDFTNVFCGGTSQVVNLNDFRKNLTSQDPANLNFTYYLTPDDAKNKTNPILTPDAFTVNNVPVYVRAENKSDQNCFQTAVLNLSLISTSLLTNTVSLCDTNNDGIENNFDLTTLDGQLFTLPINGKLHYFLSKAEADSNTNEVTKTNLTSTTEFFVKYEATNCSYVFGPIKINFLPAPAVPAPINYPAFTTCDELRDYVEPFDFLKNLGPLIPHDPTAILSFFEVEADAYSDIDSNLKTIHDGQYPIFVRIRIPGQTCFSVATVNLDITFNKVEAVNAAESVCFNGTPSVVSVDLNQYGPQMLKQNSGSITINYFGNSDDAIMNRNPIGPVQNVSINSNFVTKVFYVRFTDSTGCYAVKTLQLNLINIIIDADPVVCDFNLDGQETVTLATLDRQIIGSQEATVTYFGTEAEARATGNAGALTTYLVKTGDNKIFVRVVSSCSIEVREINITLGATPVIVSTLTPSIGTICDNNNDGKEQFDITQFESQISTDAGHSFKYYTTFNAADNSLSGFISNPFLFSVKGSTIVYVKVSNKGGCYSVATLNLNINFKPVIVLKSKMIEPLKKCDFNQDANESFNLDEAITQLFIPADNTYSLSQLTVTYYKLKADAESGNPAKKLPSTYLTSATGLTTVWARFTSITESCYSVAPIDLLTAIPPKAKVSAEIAVCDNNLDGVFEVDLTQDYTIYINDVKNFTFTFHKTQAEAKDLNSIPIANPQSFTFPASLTGIWVRVENAPGCFDTLPVKFKYGNKAVVNKGPFTITNICDAGNDGTETIDLTQLEKNIFSGVATFEYYETLADLNNGKPISSPASYIYTETSTPKKVFVKVSTTGLCPEKVEINISLKKTPMFKIQDQYFCLAEPANIKPDYSGHNIMKYEWIDPSGQVVSTTADLLNVKTAGLYKINVTAANGCTFSTEFNVKPYIVPVITSVILNGKIFTVTATGDKPILYSSDGINFQPSNTFNADNLPFGVNTFYVKFQGSECIGDPKSGLKLQNAFTPNSDGINDTWIIDGLTLFKGEKLNLKVYNRYQEKIYEEESSTRLEWDGKTLSRVVATDSYWYVLTLPDGTVYTGWVLLKNRN
ncbi:T9SS type B sorting domain-containing protein [Kaistella polysaccharea]|uniref:T9SS type B sorting domain-containing protein n=1 Tax=Kaistella polysaccharea TaxID=2878534 RepID=UPI001CF1E88B|nr:T9SS type B sorting domain-containing protein [Kaistella polysaccharea]